MDALTNLAVKYGTDKWGKHHYTPYYYDLFKNCRTYVRKLVEVGVAEGAGIRMFRDFFPNAMIYGAENDPNRIIEEDRIKVIQCDQSNIDDLTYFLDETGYDIDIWIDDGSHKKKDQILTCLTVMPLLKKDAIYIIEDVGDDDTIEYLDQFDCELVVVGDRYDDRLIIVRHKNG